MNECGLPVWGFENFWLKSKRRNFDWNHVLILEFWSVHSQNSIPISTAEKYCTKQFRYNYIQELVLISEEKN